jgi:hypothetical protein
MLLHDIVLLQIHRNLESPMKRHSSKLQSPFKRRALHPKTLHMPTPLHETLEAHNTRTFCAVFPHTICSQRYATVAIWRIKVGIDVI